MDVVKGVTLSLVGFLLLAGLGFAVINILGGVGGGDYSEAEDVDPWEEAVASASVIIMADSDYWVMTETAFRTRMNWIDQINLVILRKIMFMEQTLQIPTLTVMV